MLKDSSPILLHDFGKGSRTIEGCKTTIKNLTKKVQSSPEKAQILFKLINFYDRKSVLEIGTSLGLTTAYLSNANKNSSVTTIEGDPNIYLLAKKNFQKLSLKILPSIMEILTFYFQKFSKTSLTLFFLMVITPKKLL